MDKDTYFDKINLIYEFNKKSPLFAKAAALEIERNNFEKALQILEEGIKYYPDYPTGKLIMAQVLAHYGRVEEARELITDAGNQIDSESTVKYYLAKISEIEQKGKGIPASKRTKFIADNFEDILDEEISSELLDEFQKPADKDEIEEHLEDLAQRVSEAKIEKKENLSDIKPVPSFGDNLIISETLAGIYFAQGNLKESLYIYEKLIEDQPEKADFFRKKVAEIKELMEKN